MDSEKSLLREYLEALLIAIIFATFARTYVVQAFKIPSGSMEQNLLIGDHILVNKLIYGPTATAIEKKLLPMRDVRRGDIVVFKFPDDPSRDFIKRCMALPGDTIRSIDKVLYINGERVPDESFTFHSDPGIVSRRDYFQANRARDNFGPLVVPQESYFCMGDNRDNSNDSRFWGPVPRANVKGRAFMIYWSFQNDEGEPIDWPGYGGKLRQIAQVIFNFFPNTRWERTFHVVR